MKKPYIAIILFLGIISCEKSSGVSDKEIDRELVSKSESIIKSNNDFGYRLLKSISSKEDANMMISPLSISMAIAMTLNGAENETAEAIKSALGYKNEDIARVNEIFMELTEALLNADKKVNMIIANSIWYKSGFNVEDEFIKTNENYYNARIEELNFNNAEASKNTINNWVGNQTNNKIESIVDEITQAHVMFLINAIYFKGQWSVEFEKEKTIQGYDFTDGEGNIHNVSMMNVNSDFNWAKTETFTCLEMTYGNGKFAMRIFLPENGNDFEDVINVASINDTWENNFVEDEIQVYIPRFKFEYEKTLNEVLTTLGMGIAFSPGAADFGKISKTAELYISEVKHKTFIEVNEEGTEAAAATSVGVSVTSVQEPKVFKADRPFLFTINEKTTGAILFAGKFEKP